MNGALECTKNYSKRSSPTGRACLIPDTPEGGLLERGGLLLDYERLFQYSGYNGPFILGVLSIDTIAYSFP